MFGMTDVLNKVISMGGDHAIYDIDGLHPIHYAIDFN